MKTFLIALLLAGSVSWAASDLSQVNVFPNPVRVYQGQTAVTFAQITDQVTIKIYDIQGSLVAEIAETNSGGQTQWLLTNNSGHAVASGVYVYVITNDAGEKKKGKLAIIR